MLLLESYIPVVDVVDGVRSSRQSEEGLVFGERGAAILATAVTVDWAGPEHRA